MRQSEKKRLHREKIERRLKDEWAEFCNTNEPTLGYELPKYIKDAPTKDWVGGIEFSEYYSKPRWMRRGKNVKTEDE